MPNSQDIEWFKQSFGPALVAALAGTPFDPDQLIAIASQETGHIWSVLRKKPLTLDQIVALCVGDTIDYKGPGKGRQAFPRTRAALLAEPGGQAMFAIARQALVDMAAHIPGYDGAVANPDKFCHGYGVFQRDLQFYKVDPGYFLNRRYEVFAETLAQCLGELRRGVKKLGFEAIARLSDAEFCKVAIAYNTGGYKAAKGLKQGHFDGVKFYGEHIADYIDLSRTVLAAAPVRPGPHEVIARGGLKLRAGPGTAFDWEEILPLGTLLQVVRADPNDPAWALVDLQGDGLVDGYVFAAFLAAAPPGDGSEAVPEPG